MPGQRHSLAESAYNHLYDLLLAGRVTVDPPLNAQERDAIRIVTGLLEDLMVGRRTRRLEVKPARSTSVAADSR
jgi:hypothetical protein